MSRFYLSHAAALDLDEIDDHTIAQFGVSQAIKLRQTFEERFDRLMHHPDSGVRRPERDPPPKMRYGPRSEFYPGLGTITLRRRSLRLLLGVVVFRLCPTLP